ncbi:MAG TPA: hypothetical protein VGI31_08005 [Streptosporangiaceae bacterium]
MSGPAGDGGPDAALDRLDAVILDAVRDAFQAADPPPPDLDQRVLFAIALDDIEAEVARLQRETPAGAGARGDDRVRTLTFDAADLTVMISVTATGGDLVRIDGWLAPPGPRRVELRLAAGPGGTGGARTRTADAAGRFVFGQVPRGLAQLLVRAGEPGGGAVVTPSFVL